MVNEGEGNELDELQGLGESNMGDFSATVGEDYVETNVNDIRRSKYVHEDL